MKFKVILQTSRDDCGAACIGMILNNYFNKNMSLCEIRPLIKNTINGTSFGDIKNNINKFLANWIPCIVQIDIESSTANLAIEENFMKLYYAKLLNGLTVKVLIVLIVFLPSIISHILGLFLASMFSVYFNIIIPSQLSAMIASIMII
ncbi:cysteine peptidase family C39 domain-containing protein [Enterococcus diestrammenae]|uniref:cysteine peptidase family C39 domain-containing protein n=1 Tax=Enterococcus diestrammenae TaxID=1155073 RepID=UPI001956EB35